MHMADALVSATVGGGFWALSGGTLAGCSRRVRRVGDEGLVPLMGVLGAFVFAVQMVNFAIPGTGSSGHLGGGLLLAAPHGPGASTAPFPPVPRGASALRPEAGWSRRTRKVHGRRGRKTVLGPPLWSPGLQAFCASSAMFCGFRDQPIQCSGYFAAGTTITGGMPAVWTACSKVASSAVHAVASWAWMPMSTACSWS